MKKRSILNISSLAALLCFMLFVHVSCTDDFFEQSTGDRINPELHYQNMIDARVSLLGAISPLQDILPKMILIDGLRSDMMDVTPNADAHMRRMNIHEFTADNPYISPADLYKVIININEVLLNIDRVKRDRNYNLLTEWTVKGALVGMRAWTYFTLAKTYDKIAYIDDNMVSLPANLQQNFLTKNEIIDILIEQLQPYIVFDATVQFTEERIPNYINNKALLGELYLEKNDYVNAAKFIKMGLESYGNDSDMYKIDRAYREAAWRNLFLNAESHTAENIAVMPFASRQGQYNPLAYWMGYDLDYRVKPTQLLVDSFMTQKRAAGPRDLWRGYGITFGADTIISGQDTIKHNYILKYAMDSNDPFSTDIIFSRVADLHLKLAEALNRIGDTNSQNWALLLINNGFASLTTRPAAYSKWNTNQGIRGRVLLAPRVVPATLIGIARTEYIEDLILAERALELAFEGKRWDDLVRVANRRTDPATYLADKVAAKFQGTPDYDLVRTRLLDTNNWYLPVN
jgi:starch-binding outer membrane protein, SusD/RagB family